MINQITNEVKTRKFADKNSDAKLLYSFAKIPERSGNAKCDEILESSCDDDSGSSNDYSSSTDDGEIAKCENRNFQNS